MYLPGLLAARPPAAGRFRPMARPAGAATV